MKETFAMQYSWSFFKSQNPAMLQRHTTLLLKNISATEAFNVQQKVGYIKVLEKPQTY